MSSRTRKIPSTGEPLPPIGLGTWRAFDVGESPRVRAPLATVLSELVAAAGSARPVVDSSPMYGRSEEVVGEIASKLSLTPKLFLATKVWTTGREAGILQMEESLAKLQTGSLDLIEVHNLVDVETHLPTLREWKERGRVRYVGVTHYSASAHASVARVLEREPLDFLQINYSVAERDAEHRLLPLAAKRGVAVIANRPFASGELLRRLRRKALPGWAADLGCGTWAQLALKFVISHPAVTCVIPATANPEHLRENLAAAADPVPDEKTRNRIAAAFDAA